MLRSLTIRWHSPDLTQHLETQAALNSKTALDAGTIRIHQMSTKTNSTKSPLEVSGQEVSRARDSVLREVVAFVFYSFYSSFDSCSTCTKPMKHLKPSLGSGLSARGTAWFAPLELELLLCELLCNVGCRCGPIGRKAANGLHLVGFASCCSVQGHTSDPFNPPVGLLNFHKQPA